jgi:hypothetical protein
MSSDELAQLRARLLTDYPELTVVGEPDERP